MNLEVESRHIRSWSVKLSRTIETPDPGEEIELDVWWYVTACLWHCDRRVGVCVESSIAHQAFEQVMAVCLVIFPCLECLLKPSRRVGLMEVVSMYLDKANIWKGGRGDIEGGKHDFVVALQIVIAS